MPAITRASDFRRSLRRLTAALAIAGALVVTGLAGRRWLDRTAAPVRTPSFRQITANPIELPISAVGLSPDGRLLAYSDSRGIFLQRVDNGDIEVLPDTAGMVLRGWSSDGRQVRAFGGPRSPGSDWTIPIAAAATRSVDPPGVASPDGSRRLIVNGREFHLGDSTGAAPRRLGAVEAAATIAGSPAWAPDGKRFAYVKQVVDAAGVFLQTVETRAIDGTPPVVLVPALGGNQVIEGLVWPSPERLVFARLEPPPGASFGDFNLWHVPIDPATGARTADPERLTRWTGAGLRSLSATADGRGLAVLRSSTRADVYIAQLDSGGTRIGEPRRLTLDARADEPTDWTADSRIVLFHSNRQGTQDVFKQYVINDYAEAIAQGPEQQWLARADPGGASVLYLSHAYGQAFPARLMRAPLSGGSTQELLASNSIASFHCPAQGRCVIEEWRPGTREIAVSAFQPGVEKLEELFRRPGQVSEADAWRTMAMTRDGQRFAYVEAQPGNTIRVVSRTGAIEREIKVSGAEVLSSVFWSPDGTRLYVGANSAGGAALLAVDMAGRSDVLWEKKGLTHLWGIPSPDGRQLAIFLSAVESNAWLLEES
jgi:Tol biopolymer transport system component